MRYRDIRESPELVDPSEFGFDDTETNRRFTDKQMDRVSEVLRDEPTLQLVRTGDGNQGWYLLFNRKTHLSDYVIQYAVRKWKWLPRTVTQCILWRRVGSVSNQGITRDVFFNILLPRYGAIMSDRQQTESGHSFWLDRMAAAVASGMRVGIADMMTHTVDWFSGDSTDLTNWVRDKHSFGRGQKYQSLRYLIVS